MKKISLNQWNHIADQLPPPGQLIEYYSIFDERVRIGKLKQIIYDDSGQIESCKSDAGLEIHFWD